MPIDLVAAEAAFIQSGVSVLAGTRDAELFPHCVRGLGARVESAGAELTIFIPRATAGAMLANLRHNGRLAVCFSRAADHRSLQVKGQWIDVRPGEEADRAWIDRYRHNIAAAWDYFGFPAARTLRIVHWPVWCVRFRPDAVFVQTPGPGAGDPLRKAAAGA